MPKRRESDAPIYTLLSTKHWILIVVWLVALPLILQLTLYPAAMVAIGTLLIMAIPIAQRLYRSKHKAFWYSVALTMICFTTWLNANVIFSLSKVMVLSTTTFSVVLHIAFMAVAFAIIFLQTLHWRQLVVWFSPLFLLNLAVASIRIFYPETEPVVIHQLYRVLDIALIIFAVDSTFLRKKGGQVTRIFTLLFVGWGVMDFIGIFGLSTYGHMDTPLWTDQYVRMILGASITFVFVVAFLALFDETPHFSIEPSTNASDTFGFSADLALMFLPLFILMYPYELATGPRLILCAFCFVAASVVLANYRRLQAMLNLKNTQLSSLAFTDDLTKIFNRTGLQEHIDDIQYEHISVFFIDLNGFKFINDDYGHIAGDYLLSIVAKRLTKILPEQAILARYGGDEFVALIREQSPEEDEHLVRAIKTIITKPVFYEDVRLTVSATVGLSRGTQSDNLIKLIQSADSNMYVKKSLFYLAKDAQGADEA